MYLQRSAMMLRLPGVQLKDFGSAIRDYSRALEVDPSNPYAYYNRGISHDRDGDYQAVPYHISVIRMATC